MGLTEELPSWIRKYLTPNGDELQIKGNTSMGDDNNYTEFKSDGEINLHGTARVYTGQYMRAHNFKAPASGAASETNRGIGAAYEFADSSVQSIYTGFRIPAIVDFSEDVIAILLWESPATASGCDWEVHYQFKALDEAMDDSTETGNVTSTKTSSGTANRLVHSTFTIPANDISNGDKMCRLKITRDGTTDSLGNSAYLHAILTKGIKNKLGGDV